MTFEQFFEHVKRTAVMQGRRFTDPDDDWAITVLVEHPGERPYVIPIASWVSNDAEAKHMLGLALAGAARITKPTKIGMIQSSWMVSVERDQARDPKLRPSQHPDRVETLFVAIADPEVQWASSAQIHRRRRRPPVLGPWEDIKDGELDGQMFAPLIEALR